MIFPPGRAKLTTKPLATGSLIIPTMGTVRVAFCAAWAAGVLSVTMASTRNLTTSTASFGNASALPSAKRYSMVMFCPSTQPYSFNPCVTASSKPRALAPCSLVAKSRPRRCVVAVGCCARAASGQAAATHPTNVMNSRLLMASSKAQGIMQTNTIEGAGTPVGYSILEQPRPTGAIWSIASNAAACFSRACPLLPDSDS